MEIKKNVVIMEMLYPDGHKHLNYRLVKILSKIRNVICLDYKNYCVGEDQNNSIKLLKLPIQFLIRKHEPIIRLGILLNILIAKIILKINRIDFETIIFLSSNIYITQYLKFLFGGKKVVMIHHNDIDSMFTYSYAHIFNRCVQDVHHIVFADFIKNKLLEEFRCTSDIIHVIHHPINFEINSDVKRKNTYSIVGISLSNDENFIKECIEIDKRKEKQLPYNMVLRSKETSYNGNNLKVITGYLSYNEYEDYIKETNIALLCFPIGFKYRYSGTLINSIAQGCKILMSNIPLANEESERYPNLIKIYSKAEDLFQIPISFFEQMDFLSDREKYLRDHSDKTVENELQFV